LQEAFHQEHERTYGHRAAADPVELVTIKVLARVAAGTAPAANERSAGGVVGGSRPVQFGPGFGLRGTPVLGRGDLTAHPRQGPMVIDEYDATCVVPPDFAASLDGFGNISIQFADPGASRDLQ
jgi:N-methylhydantoinase A